MKRREGWMRRYWQGLLIAAAVSYGQLQDSAETDVLAAQKHPYVWMLPDVPRGLHPGEVVGQSVLTLPLDIDRDPSPN
jgi:hypothetical protein